MGFQQLRALCDIIFYCGMHKCFMQRKNQWHGNTLLSIPIHIKHKATFRVRTVFETMKVLEKWDTLFKALKVCEN